MIYEKAQIYAGFCWKRKVNGRFKIGMTEKNSPAQRFSQLRKKEHFEGLKYLTLLNTTHAEVLAVESYVRLMMSRVPGLEHVEDDHFEYTIIQNEKYEQAYNYANLAMTFAKQACQMYDIEYKEGKRKYKRG